MKIEVDPLADCAYISFREINRGDAVRTTVVPKDRVPNSHGLFQGIHLDWDAEDRLIGIEILGASSMLPVELLKK